jgi:succinate-semialdehyde dehydrogenase/glutarate-semialdehyde dehydrogenase
VIASINPATGETVREFQELTDAELEQKLACAESAFAAYRRTSFAQRATWLEAAAGILEGEKDRIGRIITLEMGKPVAAARAEVVKCASACRYYVENGERLLSDEPVNAGSGLAFARLGGGTAGASGR